eukprot:TRINITY_DN1338_c0_g1_i1.p1 TRINITY_DN1338_c0_g1~~TRINITY_DN1338_c0_g1_i1.p1  ORF type:complete len:322 (+),score=29.37 TRINITY_DN1338_c0_g1_i1:69-1034(+)
MQTEPRLLRRLSVIASHFPCDSAYESHQGHHLHEEADLRGSLECVGSSSSSSGHRLAGKVAIVTGVGTSRSIGYQSAVLMGQHGAKVLCVDIKGDGLEDAVKEIKALGSDAFSMTADVTNESHHKQIINEVLKRWGRLDIYFANAGIVGSAMVHWTDISSEDFERTLRINTLGVFLSIKYAAEAMAKNPSGSGGSIIVTASVAGLRAGAGPSDYSASKAAAINLVQTTAFQLPGSKIRVNAICPGLIETDMTAMTFEMAKQRGTTHKIGQLNPTKRAGQPQEVAPLVLFLASDEATYINGQAIPVCGGLSCALPHVPGRIG